MSPIIENWMNLKSSIETHLSWMGRIPGLQAEKKLRKKDRAYLYLLRAGENEDSYYVTFTLPDYSVKHQPFKIDQTSDGWVIESSVKVGPYKELLIENVLHLIMHCHKDECTPLVE